MNSYYVNIIPQTNRDHEVHKEGCTFMPSVINRKYLGIYSSCREAVAEAKKTYPRSNGCFYCSRECHTS